MNKFRKIAIIAGVLFIIGSLAGILSEVFGPNLNAQNFLAVLSSNENKVIIQALFELLMGLAVVGIAVAVFPVLKKLNEGMALGYVVARTIEGLLFINGIISLLMLLTLSQEFSAAVNPDAAYFQTLGTLSLAVREWGGGVCSTIVFSLGSLIFYYLLYKSKLIPQWLSGWGLIGAALYLLSGFFPLFGHDSRSTIYLILEMPLAVNEMVLAAWLIFKGFNASAVFELSAEKPLKYKVSGVSLYNKGLSSPSGSTGKDGSF
jgi:hypothetical protein